MPRAQRYRMSAMPRRHLTSFVVAIIAFGSTRAHAQDATYHLHKEASTTSGLSQLKTIGPDAQTTRASEDLRSQPPGAYVIKAFDTQAGVPKLAGVIPAGSTIT